MCQGQFDQLPCHLILHQAIIHLSETVINKRMMTKRVMKSLIGYIHLLAFDTVKLSCLLVVSAGFFKIDCDGL